ncbi:MAG: hypothetical protein QXD86_01620 [Candidatus Bathyarchaeia archaeon]
MFEINPELERDEALKARVIKALKAKHEEERVGRRLSAWRLQATQSSPCRSGGRPRR